MEIVMTTITHPIALESVVEAKRPQCPCKGASFTLVTGRVKKVITNQSGHWYYLDNRITVPANAITRVL
jgi:hypothetical protein